MTKLTAFEQKLIEGCQPVKAASLLEMSNLRPDDTGLKGLVIWVSAGEFGGKDAQHGPRVKVIVGGGRVNDENLDAAPSVKISDGQLVHASLDGKLLKKVRAFLDLNRELLLKYWHQEIGTKAMVNAIKPFTKRSKSKWT